VEVRPPKRPRGPLAWLPGLLAEGESFQERALLLGGAHRADIGFFLPYGGIVEGREDDGPAEDGGWLAAPGTSTSPARNVSANEVTEVMKGIACRLGGQQAAAIAAPMRPVQVTRGRKYDRYSLTF